MVLLAVGLDGDRGLRGPFDLALRPETEAGFLSRRAADPELHLQIVVRGEDEDAVDHLAELVEKAVGCIGGDCLCFRLRWGGVLGRQWEPLETGDNSHRT